MMGFGPGKGMKERRGEAEGIGGGVGDEVVGRRDVGMGEGAEEGGREGREGAAEVKPTTLLGLEGAPGRGSAACSCSERRRRSSKGRPAGTATARRTWAVSSSSALGGT